MFDISLFILNAFFFTSQGFIFDLFHEKKMENFIILINSTYQNAYINRKQKIIILHQSYLKIKPILFTHGHELHGLLCINITVVEILKGHGQDFGPKLFFRI